MPRSNARQRSFFQARQILPTRRWICLLTYTLNFRSEKSSGSANCTNKTARLVTPICVEFQVRRAEYSVQVWRSDELPLPGFSRISICLNSIKIEYQTEDERVSFSQARQIIPAGRRSDVFTYTLNFRFLDTHRSGSRIPVFIKWLSLLFIGNHSLE